MLNVDKVALEVFTSQSDGKWKHAVWTTRPPIVRDTFSSPAGADSLTDHSRQVIARISDFRPQDPDQESHFEGQLEEAAKTFGRLVLSDRMVELLWRVRQDWHEKAAAREGDTDWPRAPTLLVSNEIVGLPWELLWLRDPSGETDGGYLAEVFALAHWLSGHQLDETLSLERVALVAAEPSDEYTLAVGKEVERLLKLSGPGRVIEKFEPLELDPLVAEMRRGVAGGWHFAGHGGADADDATASAFSLGTRLGFDEKLTAARIIQKVESFGPRRPLVFANFCSSGERSPDPSLLPGFVESCIATGASAYLGTHWKIDGEAGAEFSPMVYERLLEGMPLGQAVWQARLALKEKKPGNPAWLAYVLYGPPFAHAWSKGSQEPAAVPLGPSDQGTSFGFGPSGQRELLALPSFVWRAGGSPPSSLLRPDYGVVPFHGRDGELTRLSKWVTQKAPFALHICSASAGQGKTRLALEMCGRMRLAGWRAGFWHARRRQDLQRLVDRLPGDVLMVLDGSAVELWKGVLEGAEKLSGDRRLRVLVLTEGFPEAEAEGELVTRRELGALAPTASQRRESFELASAVFAARQGASLPSRSLGELEEAVGETSLVLHLRALVASWGECPRQAEDDLWRVLLRKERLFWDLRIRRRDLPAEVLPVIEMFMASVSAEGIPTGVAATRHLEQTLGDADPDLGFESLELIREMYGARKVIDALYPPDLGKRLTLETASGPRGAG